MLGLGFCFVSVFHNSLAQILNPTADHRHQKRRVGPCSCLSKSNTLTLALLPQVLLPCSFLEISSTWFTKMAARKTLKGKTKKITQMIPLITCEISLQSTSLRVGFLVSTYLIWILGSKLILSNNQSRATLWFLDTCLSIGLRPWMINLDHGLVVFKKCTAALHIEGFACAATRSAFDNCSTFWLPSLLDLTVETSKRVPAAPLALPVFAEFIWVGGVLL